MEMQVPIPDRRAAGRVLGGMLGAYRGRDDCIVLALPRGGVPVAAEIARMLRLPLDVMVVRKLGLPGHPELAMGAIASGGVRVMNEEVVRGAAVTPRAIEAVADEEERELARRERRYRGDRPWPELAGRCVILVDDGLATGATMRAAIAALRSQRPARIVVAVPVGAPEVVRALGEMADEVICPLQPQSLGAVGRWYRDFTQVSDGEVERLLAGAENSGER